MKIKINNLGYLEIMRGSKWKPQECPFTDAMCGDWCPRFRDPVYGGDSETLGLLELCDGAIWSDDIIDERE